MSAPVNLLPEMDNEEDSGSARRGMDPELKAMGSILRTMEDLEPDARARVIVYLSSRFPVAGK